MKKLFISSDHAGFNLKEKIKKNFKKKYYSFRETWEDLILLIQKRPKKVIKVSIEQSKTELIVFNRLDGLDKFEYKKINKKLTKKINYKESIIKNSLYESAINQNISPNIIIEFARIYGFQIDFQRDIWKNDSFQIIYETFLDPNKKTIETGEILYANLILQGKENNLYIFKTKDG